ncbi:DUF2235 domain-containing protein [Thiotrichales bacterium 19X7-9]|nr:DUF2235 domain-containing protein [Thiotrichales bacterium 19X7-9]
MIKKKISLFFDGTWANKDYESFGYNLLTAKNSTIAQLYSESQLIEDQSKFYYPGPGTDESGIGFINWLAGASGDMGKYSVEANVNRAYKQICTKLTNLKDGEKLDLQCIGWSRGGVTVDRLMYRLHSNLPLELKNKLDIILCNKIDPVPGGVFDRGDKVRNLVRLNESDEFTKKVFSFTYYSDTGSLNSTSLLKDNFSALYDPNYQSNQYAFPANHEEIAGVEDDTGSSEIIKDHIKLTAKYFDIQTYSTEFKESYRKIRFPESIRDRGFLRPDEINHKLHHRIISAPSLTEDMLKNLKSPEKCVEEIEKMNHELTKSSIDVSVYESCIENPSNVDKLQPDNKFTQLKNLILTQVEQHIQRFETRNSKALNKINSEENSHTYKAQAKWQNLKNAKSIVSKSINEKELISAINLYNTEARVNTAKWIGLGKSSTPTLLFANYKQQINTQLILSNQ